MGVAVYEVRRVLKMNWCVEECFEMTAERVTTWC